jgi:D-3-phosphoglycerate dehydrogenase / 2-oxoglutarate reductase
MNKMGEVLIAAPVHTVLTDGLKAQGYTCLPHEHITQLQAYELIKDCVGVITSTRLQLDKELIDAAPKLKWIGRMGSGMEVVDVVYAVKKGIACYASPEGNANAVGEHAIGMLLSLLHRIAWSYSEMKSGIWLREENRGVELEGKTVGIIGYGHTGRAFAEKLSGFRTHILAYDKYNPESIPPHIVNCESLFPIFDQADIVSFHVPLQEDTIHYFNEEFVEKMHKPFILVNCSRGKVVDTGALLQGITSGKITGACLDVFEREPISAMNSGMKAQLESMMRLPNMVVTPHIAGYTHDALYKMSKVLLEKITGQIPQ